MALLPSSLLLHMLRPLPGLPSPPLPAGSALQCPLMSGSQGSLAKPCPVPLMPLLTETPGPALVLPAPLHTPQSEPLPRRITSVASWRD